MPTQRRPPNPPSRTCFREAATFLSRSLRAPASGGQRVRGTELSGKSVGVFGSARSAAFRGDARVEMRVWAYDPFVTGIIEEAGGELVTLDASLGRADYVSFHCPLTDQTRNRLTLCARANEAGRRHINCARGALVMRQHFATLCKMIIWQAWRLTFMCTSHRRVAFVGTRHGRANAIFGASTKEAQQAVSVKIGEIWRLSHDR